ncbi:MAG: TonB-dependent receptor [Pseudomonadota bacterium]
MLRQPIRLALGLPALSLAMTLPSGALAQDNEADDLEEIVVTGSRIQRDPNSIASQPVQSLSAEDIQLSGEFSISDVVNDVPALFSSTTSENSLDAGFAAGTNTLNLRGLGANRTLVLVDGRRHVAGVAGQQAVDIGSIPPQLIERVEVLTGGASAVYGADAVTGVVNFILKDDYEGFQIDAMTGVSSEGDSNQSTISAVWGQNFMDDRANFTVAVDYRRDDGLLAGERDDGVLLGSARDWVNPALRFQQGEITDATPNFQQFYNFDNTGLTDFGLPIPLPTDEEFAAGASPQDAFIAQYTAQFGAAPTLTEAELALINRAATAPQRAVLPGRTFPFTSGYGYIIPGNPFTFSGFDPATDIDLDGNGRPDCLDSFTGYNSSFGDAAFGVVGGCWNVGADGSYRPVRDGLVSGNFQGFGGDSLNTIQQENGYIIPPEEKITLNLLGRYDLTDRMSVFGEFKWVTQENEDTIRPNSFWDLLFGAPDNPFLPEFIQPVADANGGVAITIDPIGIGSGRRLVERETTRLVLGIEGELENGWQYEVSANYGRFVRDLTDEDSIINDRYLAAIDAVIDPATGQPACRSSVDPSAPATTTPFNIPDYDPGYFSFTPGDGSCVPLNIWAGATGITQEAVDFVTQDSMTKSELRQEVWSAFLSGNTEEWFSLQGGPVGFATGAEWRREESSLTFDAFQRGVLPAGSPFGAGTNIQDVSGNANVVFRPALANRNEQGDYEALDAFVEVSLPLLAGVTGAEELTLDAAVRASDYTTIGEAVTWKTSLSYAPVDDIRFRSTFSEAVRAPNITELFQPTTGITSRPADPCDAAQISAIAADDPTRAARIQANCVADFAAVGLDPFVNGVYSFADPLSAAFGGVSRGNPGLEEETAETFSIGFVAQPGFLEGLTVSVDYWSIDIEQAIAQVSDQDIVNACYEGNDLNPLFCDLFTRNADPGSLQFGGFNFIERQVLNFAALETDGIDFSVSYDFNIGDHGFNARLNGTKVNDLNRFSDPVDRNVVDVELGEVQRPELAGNFFLTWMYEGWTVQVQTLYQDEQLLRFVEIDDAQTLYGNSVFQDAYWQHDLSAAYQYNDSLGFFGGIKNVTDEDPFITDVGYPASPRGRFFFFGVNYAM